jgi:hypothetical protein
MFIKAKNIRQAQYIHPGAAAYVKLRNGFIVFDYAADYMAWKRESC